MNNKIRIEIKNRLYEHELPFKPAPGDFLILEGIDKDTGEKDSIILRIPEQGMVYHCRDGVWQIRTDAVEGFYKDKEARYVGGNQLADPME